MLEAILWFTCNKISRVLYKRERKREKGGIRSFVLGFHASFLFRFLLLDRNKRRLERSRESFENPTADGSGSGVATSISRDTAPLFPRWSFSFFFFSIAADRRAISLVTLELGDLSERENIMRPPLVYACLYSFSLSKSVRVLHR